MQSPPHRARRPWIRFALPLLLAVVAVAGAGAYIAAQLPGLSQRLPVNVTPFIVTLSRPPSGSTYPSNSSIQVAAKALSGRPLVALELWADGTLVERKEAPPGSADTHLFAFWSWEPGRQGEHLLVARAVDVEGAVGDSNVVRLRATAPVDGRILQAAREGDTLETVAQRWGLPVERLRELNPGIEQSAPLISGQPIFGPLPLKPPAPPEGEPGWEAGSPQQTQPRGADESSYQSTHWTGVGFHDVPLELDGGKLVVPGGLDRLYYYLSVDDGLWTRVPADPDSFISPTPPAMPIPQEGDGVTAGISRRASSESGSQFDLASPLGDLPAPPSAGEHSIVLEVWGWRGGDLVRVGEFSRDVERDHLATPQLWLANQTKLHVCSHSGTCREGLGWTSELLVPWSPGEDHSRDMQWFTEAGGADGAIWQLSTQPFGEPFDPSPPGLVASRALSGSWGLLRVDFADPGEQPGGQATAAGQGVVLDRATPSAGLIQRPEEPGGSGPLEMVVSGASRILNPGGLDANTPRTYYARVTPMKGNLQVGAPSNTTIVHYGPAQEQENPLLPLPPPIFEVRIEGFEPVVFPNPTLWGCVEITRNDRYTGKLDAHQPDPWSVVPAGTVVCPEVYRGEGEDPWYEALWDFVSDAVDWVSSAYESVKNTVIDVVASTIPLCGEKCKAALKMGLNVALVAAGLPPSLPSFDALTEMGEAYMVSYLAQQVGAECSEGSLCQEAIKEGIDMMKEAARAGGNNSSCVGEEEAHRYGREPLCLPSGMVGAPIEGSEYVPARLTVEVARVSEPANVSEADYQRYMLNVGATVTNDELVGKTILVPVNTYMQYGAYVHSKTENRPLKIEEPLVGAALAAGEGPIIPRLKPGESVSIPIDFHPTPYWIPEHLEMIQEAGGYVKYDDWPKLYFDGKASFRAAIECYSTVGIEPVNCGVPDKGWDEKQYTLPSTYHP